MKRAQLKFPVDLTARPRTLTQALWDFFFTFGCQPSCHSCGKALNVGDKFAFGLMQGVRRGLPVRGSMCVPCVQASTRKPVEPKAEDLNRIEKKAGGRLPVRMGGKGHRPGFLITADGEIL